MFKKTKYFLAATALLGLALSGCSGSGDTTNNTTYAAGVAIDKTATIQGYLRDKVTQEPIVGAVVDIGVASATTNQDGQFVIQNVPAVFDAGTLDGKVEGSYLATINLKGVTSPVNMTSSTASPRYPDFTYPEALKVYYTAQTFTNASGVLSVYDYPATGLVATLSTPLSVGKLDANIKLQVVKKTDLSNVTNAKVELIAIISTNSTTGAAIPDSTTGHIVSAVFTNSSGFANFTKVEAGQSFLARATSSDGSLAGQTDDLNNDGSPNGPRKVTAEADNVTVSYLLNHTKEALRVATVETAAPVIIGVSAAQGGTAIAFENNSDITPAATDITFTFSEGISQNAYATATTASSSAIDGLYKKIAVNFNGSKSGNIAYSLTWVDAKNLKVSLPALAPSSKYTVDLSGCTGLVNSANGGITFSGSSPATGKVQFTTNGGATAAAPVVVVANKATMDFTSPVNLDWLPASGAKKYNVYRTLIENWGATTTATPYRLIATGITSSDYPDNFADDGVCTNGIPSVGVNCNAISHDTSNLALAGNFVEAGHVQLTYNYIVKSVNSDGTEGAASAVQAPAVADVVGSNIVNAGATFITDIIDGNSTITVFSSEPLDEASAETATNYTLSGISGTAPTVSSAVYNGWDAVNGRSSVTLTLSANLTAANITRSYISTGADGILSTAVVALDGALFPPNSGGVCVSPVGTGDTTGTTLSTVVAGDDIYFTPNTAPTGQATTIYAGADGTCNSTAVAGDTQVVAPTVKPAAGAIGIYAATYTNAVINNTANDFTLQTVTLNGIPPATGTADDLVVRQILVTLGTGLKDVAGNAIKTTTTNATTAGNRINSDGTFTLP